MATFVKLFTEANESWENLESSMVASLRTATFDFATIDAWFVENMSKEPWFHANMPIIDLLSQVKPEHVSRSIVNGEYDPNMAKSIYAANLISLSLLHSIFSYAPSGAIQAVSWINRLFPNGLLKKPGKQQKSKLEQKVLLSFGTLAGYHRKALGDDHVNQTSFQPVIKMSASKRDTKFVNQIIESISEQVTVDFDTFCDATALLMALHDSLSRIEIEILLSAGKKPGTVTMNKTKLRKFLQSRKAMKF